MAAIGFEVCIQIPDLAAHPLLILAMALIERDQLVHQPLGMDPAQAVEQDGKLPGSVADDRHFGREPLFHQAAEQGSFRGDAAMALTFDPQGIEMGLPAGDFADCCMGMCLQAAQWLLGQTLFVQVGQGVRIEAVADAAGVEQLQKVDPTLAAGARKPGEPVVADLRHVAVVAPMARPGIVHRDVATDLQAGHQQLVLLLEKTPDAAAEQRVDLSHRDVDAPRAQLFVQQRLGDVAVVVLVERVAAKLRPEVSAVEVRRQLTKQALAVRRLPDLQAVTCVVWLDAQILHHEVAIALEARVLRNRHLRRDLERLVDRELPGLAALGRPGALALSAVILVGGITIGLDLGFHAARLELRLRLLSLEHGDLVAHLLDDLRLRAVLLKQILKLDQQLLHQRTALRFGNVR